MKFKVTDGCTCFATTINGKDINEFSDDDARVFLVSLVNSVKDRGLIDMMIRDVVTMTGEHKFLYHCEECGDNVCEYNLEI
jgi:hypothetical protein